MQPHSSMFVGTWRRIMFPETGRNIPFTIENYAFIDRFGRETVSWIRTFQSRRRTRRFERLHDPTAKIVAGSSTISAPTSTWPLISICRLMKRAAFVYVPGPSGSMKGGLGFRFPMLFSGIADVREWYDDTTRRFRILVDVRNTVWGPLFGYRGSFDVEWRKVAGRRTSQPHPAAASRRSRLSETDARPGCGRRSRRNQSAQPVARPSARHTCRISEASRAPT